LDGFFDIHSLKGGARIAEEISNGLKECDVYLPILSSASLGSPWCREELSGAVTLSNLPKREGRPKIVSVLIEDCEDDLPVPILNRLYFKFARRYEQAFAELLGRGLGLGEHQSALLTPVKPVPTGVKRTPHAAISKVDTQYNVTRDTELGMVISVTFNIKG